MNKMLQKIVTKWKYTKSDVDGTSVYHNKANANKMLQKIVTKYPWKCVDVSVYHNKANCQQDVTADID